MFTGLALLVAGNPNAPKAPINESRRIATFIVGAYLLLSLCEMYFTIPQIETWRTIFIAAMSYLLGRAEIIGGK